jgi:hypothetical protein
VEIARHQANRVKDRVMRGWNKVSGEPKEESEPKEMDIVVDVDKKQSVSAGGREISQVEMDALLPIA